jgi:alkylation response protein AidB-like acyl-CoA dehydrogenase
VIHIYGQEPANVERDIFEEEHNLFRDSARKFVEQEVRPHHDQWEKDGMVSRELWRRAGEQGMLCFEIPEEYGGMGVKDYRYNMIVTEELIRVGASGPGFSLQSDVVLPYIMNVANEEQKKRWFPKMVTGEIISAIAMSEPNTGSDLAGVQTFAEKHGDHYILNGQKTFITNGILNNLVIVVAKTDRESKHAGISLLVVERGMEGYEPSKKLHKIGMHAQDTAELFFKDVKVPVENLLGDEGQGFFYLMGQLPQERLTIAVSAVAAAEAALEWTIKYCKERKAFGRPIGTFQNSRFKLAEMKTEIQLGRLFVDKCIMLSTEKKLSVEEAAMSKWWCTDMQLRVIDQCLQLHGGYGYMMEYPIAKAYIDSRAQTIYGGSNEIMKEIIGRAMGF